MGEPHDRDIIEMIIPDECRGIDEPGKESNKSINAQRERMAVRHLIKTNHLTNYQNSACAIFELSKWFHGTIKFMYHKSQISVSKSDFYR